MGRPAEIVQSVFTDPKMYRGKQVVKSKRPILTFASKTSNSFTKSFSGWFSMFFCRKNAQQKSSLYISWISMFVFFQKKCTQKKFAVYSRYFKHSFLRSTNKSFKAYGISMNVTRYRTSLTQLFGGDFYNQHTFLKLKGVIVWCCFLPHQIE